ncbi:50S ribosomal protein L10 [Georgenia deserti]|uniref:Large ribosomal subunit protein uL10 n=1 Tax=Georgenia deserti TaxID=2093781 RepID=A0ABW4L063_9MICO|nr:50S ribosomal protein L10 [Glycomyces sp.]
MARPDKAAAVAELTDQFRAASAVMLTEYRGLSVSQLQELRRSLSGTASYAVVKNTLATLAAREAGLEDIEEDLAGPTAIAFVTGEPVDAAKALRDFAKANSELVIKGGVVEGSKLSADGVNKLAELESRDVLLGKAAGAFKAALFQAAYVFNAPTTQAARAVEALREKQAAAA